MRLNRAQGEAVEHGEGPLLVLAGRRVGQDARHHAPHRAARRARRAGEGDRRAHVHQQGGRRDARARRRARVADARGARKRPRRGGRRDARASPSRRSTPSASTSSGASARRSAGASRSSTRATRPRSSSSSCATPAPTARTTRPPCSRGSRTRRTRSSRPTSSPSARATPTTRSPRSSTRATSRRSSSTARSTSTTSCARSRACGASAKTCAPRWQSEYLYVLVDEYQDTNRAQLEMLRLLCGTRRNVCAVGDDDQAIYGWRGADVRNILDFERHFERRARHQARAELPLVRAHPRRGERGHREAHRLEVAQGALHRARRAGARCASPSRRRPRSRPAGSVARSGDSLREEGKRPRDIAVLYRSNGQSRLLEENLREQGVAHRVVGGAQFFERKEVKDVLAYLKLALNPADEISLRRIVNYPPRGIGETALDRLVANAYARGWSLWQAVERVDALDDVPAAAREGCRALEKVIVDARKELFGAKRPPSEVARAIADRVAMKAAIDVGAPSPERGGQAMGQRRGRARDARAPRGARTPARAPEGLARVPADAHDGHRDGDGRRGRRRHALDAARQQGPRVRRRVPGRLRGGLPAPRADARRARDRRRARRPRARPRPTSKKSAASSTSA